jgi:hypothetical protein
MDNDYYYNICDECSALGDDYYIDENDELRCACVDCTFNVKDHNEYAQD